MFYAATRSSLSDTLVATGMSYATVKNAILAASNNANGGHRRRHNRVFIHTDFILLRYLRRNKLQLLYCRLSVYLLLFTASCYLLSHILWSVFIISIFKATNAKSQLALFRVTNIWRNATLPAVRCKSFTFYKVLW